MKDKHILLLIALLLLSPVAFGQSMVGFWKVDQVLVGDQDVTPVAKWFKFNEDFTSQAGNGWSQNAIGTWTFQREKSEFLSYDTQGNPDEFGAFKTTFSDGLMFWERVEEGMTVKVTLSPTSKMPMSPKDRIAGNWELISVVEEGDIIPFDSESIFISWTGNYRITNSDGSRTHGIWHMDAHDPEFHMIDWNQDVDFVAFDVAFENDVLTMIPWQNREMVYTYRKL